MDKISKNNFLLILPKKSKYERIFYLNRVSNFRSIRKRLKKLIGMAIFRYPNETFDHIKEIVSLLNPKTIVTVGDFVTKSFLKEKIKVNVAIFDLFLENKQVEESYNLNFFKEVFKIKNPRGTITKNSYLTVKEALKKDSVAILVDGEEDLLALVAILESDANSLIAFGLPNFGIELVNVNKRKKFILRKLIQTMF